jgi:transposase-like protein
MHPLAKRLLFEVKRASTRKDANRAIDPFAEFEPKWPKAAEKVVKDREELSAFSDFPAGHWRHLRTTNPIESSFATVKLRTRVTKGAGSKDAALAIAYKLLDAAQSRWRVFNGAELVKELLDGATFKGGIRVTNDDTTTTDERVAA